jgi:hypothetical protein
VKWKRK